MPDDLRVEVAVDHLERLFWSCQRSLWPEVAMHQIKPHLLWIGHAGDGRDIPAIIDTGIRAIVQLAMEEPPLLPPRDLIFCRFPLLDGTGNDPVLLRLAIHAVAILQRSRIATLVCCGGGMSRSPASGLDPNLLVVLGNGLDAIFLLAVPNFLDGILAMKSRWFD
jgi:hypothetical protein